MPAVEKNLDEDILKVRYLRASKIMIILAVIYSLWITFLIMGVYFLGIYKLALLTMDQWIISGIILLGVFVGLNVIFILHHYMVKRKRIESEKPKPLSFKGKKLHIYTLPTNSKGGIYSKTFVKIDGDNILNFRIQMISPYELWGKKE
ncbi:hypothetical protein MBGDF03_01214 [Thermoplasmatales archaeon SCGC AB-540-F20]|nr:hypothetical protein MBGDF03_01214 [Thermoplasmatales archaeon SCGC AB-540-F20]